MDGAAVGALARTLGNYLYRRRRRSDSGARMCPSWGVNFKLKEAGWVGASAGLEAGHQCHFERQASRKESKRGLQWVPSTPPSTSTPLFVRDSSHFTLSHTTKLK